MTHPSTIKTTDGPPSAAPSVVRLPASLSLVLPAHNEEANLGPVVAQALAILPDFADRFEIIVVDDGSHDATGAIADALALTDHRVRAIHHRRNRGYGAALRTGFAATTGGFVMFMDSDRQFDLADLALLSPLASRFDIVAGFRMERNDPLHRRIFAEIFNVTVRLLFGVHLRDIDCAFKLFRGDLLRGLDLAAPGALINTEIQAKARRQGASVAQVGVHHYPRLAGSPTGGSPRVILRAMRETLVLWQRMRSYRPRAIDQPVAPASLVPTGHSRDSMVAGAIGALAAVVLAIGRRIVGRR